MGEESRHALIIANDSYENPGLKKLRAPAQDAVALAEVLGDPQIGGFDVRVMRNEPAHVISMQVDDFFSDRKPGDTLVLHFSCHGLKSETGELFFAAPNTLPRRLASTAVAANFVRRCMASTRARSIALLLDCCYGGAFSQGPASVRAGGDAHVLDSFAGDKLGGGRGWAVITASNSMEYAFEGTDLAEDSAPQPSVFTHAVVQGLATGEADLDEDGRVSSTSCTSTSSTMYADRTPTRPRGAPSTCRGTCTWRAAIAAASFRRRCRTMSGQPCAARTSTPGAGPSPSCAPGWRTEICPLPWGRARHWRRWRTGTSTRLRRKLPEP